MRSSLGILQFVFGCRHRQKSGVFTIKKRTYQVCLQCGQEFDYSWARMRSVRSNVGPVPHPPLKMARRDEEAVG